MNSSFPRIITLLRKERGLSQKKVAEELNVSQALLSHYEKGIRECGLDFVVKIADYYDVSCDYLLGRTPEKNGATIKIDDIPDTNVYGKENVYQGSLLPILNKKLISNSLYIIYDILLKCNNKNLTTQVSSYLNIAVYKSFHLLYSSNPKNPQGMFSVPQKLCDGRSNAAQEIAFSNAACIADGVNVDDMKGLSKNKLPDLSPEKISEEYPLFSSSLFNVIQNSEELMGAEKQIK
jgi:transcriptional regulator with XRE-family HTH domain